MPNKKWADAFLSGVQSKLMLLTVTRSKTNQHVDKMYYQAYEVMDGRFHLRCFNALSVQLTSPTVSSSLLLWPWWALKGSLCFSRCETSTIISSHISHVIKDWSYSPVSVSVSLYLPEPIRPTQKCARGMSVFFRCLHHSLFSYSCCWCCLSSSTNFHLGANSALQSQMELQPNTAWFGCK